MCGLVGIAGDLEYRDEKTMRMLMQLNYFRGEHSTGFASVGKKTNDVKTAKLAGSPPELFDTFRFKSAIVGSASKLFMGHARHATRGAVNYSNAHPFQFGDITGMHNGTLDWSSVTALEEALGGEVFANDSQLLFAAIDKLGMEETATMMSGAWSITYHNKADNTLNLLRNKERPLWYAYDEKFDRLFYASEWEMIAAAMRMSGTYDLWTDDKGFGYFTTEVDTHYSFNLDKLVAGAAERPKPTAKVMKGRPPRKVKSQTNSPFDPGKTTGNVTSIGPTKTTPTSTTASMISSEIIHTIGDRHNPTAGLISRERFDKWAKDGCGWCSGDVDWGDIGITIIERDEAIICQKCSKGKGGTVRIIMEEDISNLNLLNQNSLVF